MKGEKKIWKHNLGELWTCRHDKSVGRQVEKYEHDRLTTSKLDLQLARLWLQGLAGYEIIDDVVLMHAHSRLLARCYANETTKHKRLTFLLLLLSILLSFLLKLSSFTILNSYRLPLPPPPWILLPIFSLHLFFSLPFLPFFFASFLLSPPLLFSSFIFPFLSSLFIDCLPIISLFLPLIFALLLIFSCTFPQLVA